MRITFSRIATGYRYPLSRREIHKLIRLFDSDIESYFGELKVNCSTKTNHEGTLSSRGHTRRIIINFFIDEQNRSIVRNPNHFQTSSIELYGGKIIGSTAQWTNDSAKRYFMGIVFHEIGHYHYIKKIARYKKNSDIEEHWCNRFAKMAVDYVFGDSKTHPYDVMFQ